MVHWPWAALALAAVGSAREVTIEDVRLCLTTPTHPARGNDEWCEASTVHGLDALRAPIPWRTPYSVVRACLRCSVRYWMVTTGLDAVRRFWLGFDGDAAWRGKVADAAAKGCEGGQLQRLLSRSFPSRFG